MLSDLKWIIHFNYNWQSMLFIGICKGWRGIYKCLVEYLTTFDTLFTIIVTLYTKTWIITIGVLTATSSSSQRSNWASMACSARFGKLLKNFAMNCDAKRFSLSDPFTAANISKYSFSCWNSYYHRYYTEIEEHAIHKWKRSIG